MLQDLPIEVLQQIIGHLPSASSIVNLSTTCRKLHNQLATDEYAVFRSFVQTQFPSIKVSPAWRTAARALTSRARAWDKRAFIARECCPPRDDASTFGRVESGQKFGYLPVIDSYETCLDPDGSSPKEVLAWGAAGRLRIRTAKDGKTAWTSLRTVDDHLPQNDILDVRLLRPHQRDVAKGESIVLRRANGDIVKVDLQAGQDQVTETTRYDVKSNHVDCMDMSSSFSPLLAVCDTTTIQIFPVSSPESQRAPEILLLNQDFAYKHRKRCVKFLSNDTLALGVQFVEGRERSPIDIYKVRPEGLGNDSTNASASITATARSIPGRHCANVLAPLENATGSAGSGGQMFLSGWTDGITRLYDLRTPLTAVAEYVDFVDDGQILSIVPIGHERFLAGSHQNACLKTFDMRMPGARPYSYLSARLGSDMLRDLSINQARATKVPGHLQATTDVQRDINIFLAVTVNPAAKLWQPLPRRANNNFPRYRGSIYSLSTPSPSSPTVYAGIENHVIQLDFASTDDLVGKGSGLINPPLGVKDNHEHILNLSCYERPREGHESTDPVLLRKQVDWTENLSSRDDASWKRASTPGQGGYVEKGWDERWLLATHDRSSHAETRRRIPRRRGR